MILGTTIAHVELDVQALQEEKEAYPFQSIRQGLTAGKLGQTEMKGVTLLPEQVVALFYKIARRRRSKLHDEIRHRTLGPEHLA